MCERNEGWTQWARTQKERNAKCKTYAQEHKDEINTKCAWHTQEHGDEINAKCRKCANETKN
jgi:hypothetical protein